MLRRTLFTLFLFCLFPAVVLANDPGDIVVDSFEETSGRGLEVRTNPARVRVFINGVERGLTPFVFDSLQAGQYSVKLIRDGYADREFDVTLFSNSRLVVSIKMERPSRTVALSISKANDAPSALRLTPHVFVNQVSRNTQIKPDGDHTVILNLNEGHNSIIVRAFGWKDATATVLVNKDTAPVNIVMIPEEFKIEKLTPNRRVFNPLQPDYWGKTTIHFDVSAPGAVTLTITDNEGKTVLNRQLGEFTTWRQNFDWDGRDEDGDPLPQGTYTVLLEAQNQQLKTEIKIDYSSTAFPLSFTSGISGLDFSPLPETLSAGSFQISAGADYGMFNSFTGFPFELGFRISPFKNFEASTVFNINAQSNAAGWGVSGSVKYNFIQSVRNFPLAVSAGVFYTWASDNGEHPLGLGKGIGVFFPVSLPLFSSDIGSFVFNPGVFWHGPEGLTPVLVLSGGFLLRVAPFFPVNIGLSARYEIDFERENNSRFFAGTQVFVFPRVSNLYFSARGGMWTRGSNIGGYGGLGIGLIY